VAYYSGKWNFFATITTTAFNIIIAIDFVDISNLNSSPPPPKGQQIKDVHFPIILVL
jgi:hypothetical protein